MSNKLSNVAASVCVQLLYHVAKRQTLLFSASNFTLLFHVILTKLVNEKFTTFFRNHALWLLKNRACLSLIMIHCIIQIHFSHKLPSYCKPKKKILLLTQ